jgi:hypothetical protein
MAKLPTTLGVRLIFPHHIHYTFKKHRNFFRNFDLTAKNWPIPLPPEYKRGNYQSECLRKLINVGPDGGALTCGALDRTTAFDLSICANPICVIIERIDSKTGIYES